MPGWNPNVFRLLDAAKFIVAAGLVVSIIPKFESCEAGTATKLLVFALNPNGTLVKLGESAVDGTPFTVSKTPTGFGLADTLITLIAALPDGIVADPGTKFGTRMNCGARAPVCVA